MCCSLASMLVKMVVLLEFSIGETVVRRVEVDQESFENALRLITPPA